MQTLTANKCYMFTIENSAVKIDVYYFPRRHTPVLTEKIFHVSLVKWTSYLIDLSYFSLYKFPDITRSMTCENTANLILA